MNRDRIFVLVAVFATSQFAAYMLSKFANYAQIFTDIFRLIYIGNCTGTINSIVHLKKFSAFAISLIKHLFYTLSFNHFCIRQSCDIIISFCNVLENLCNSLWDAVLFINTEIDCNLCYTFGTWLPVLWSQINDSVCEVLDNWNLSGFGGIALVFIVVLSCALVYSTFIIFLIIVRLYKLFIKPLIKMLTMLLNYRRRFVLRSRRL